LFALFDFCTFFISNVLLIRLVNVT
jgi:hypothetical protein